jgi:DNA-binding transcriptional regulator WhiA
LGQGAQVKDRDDVKELLQQLLQKFKCEINKELEEKNRCVVWLHLQESIGLPFWKFIMMQSRKMQFPSI